MNKCLFILALKGYLILLNVGKLINYHVYDIRCLFYNLPNFFILDTGKQVLWQTV